MSPRQKMHSSPSPPFSWLPCFLIFLFLFGNIPPSSSFENGFFYKSCSKLFNCGKLTGVDFPFWGEDRSFDCGHPKFGLSCLNGVAKIEIMNVIYRVLDIENDTSVLRIARDDYFGGLCTSEFVNTTLDHMLFDYVPGFTNLTILYGCPPFSTVGYNVASCRIDGVPYQGVHVLPGAQGPGICNTSVIVPVIGIDWLKLGNYSSLDRVLQDDGFEVKWKVANEECSECTRSGGKCGYNPHVNQTTCFCPNELYGTPACTLSPEADAPRASKGAPVKSSNNNNTLIIGLSVAGAAAAMISLGVFFFFVRQRRKKVMAESKSKGLPTPPSSNGLPTPFTNFSRTTPSYPSSLSTDLEKGSMYFGVQVFTYEELVEATDNFEASRELGDGGFGVVYYGKLHDGRVVAVKRLYENSFKRVEQFINEVELLARLRHPNLVTLYGCTSKRSPALLLVYEYIPNGTVADHLHGNRSDSGMLTWPVRLSIAIETAGALAYLHKSDIIHRDVKTNNILLDTDFRVKVADFGLSRLFPTDVTHVSTAPQGTPGYVDPEYYQCYQLTDKSDVYSFGVVLVELISSMQAVDTNRHRHDINLSNMAVNKIQNHTLHELVDPNLGFETDEAVRRTATSVAELAFRCLQQDRDMRPSMEEVLESLKVIENEELKTLNAEVVDIRSDDVGLLKNMPPPYSPDSAASFKWANGSNAASSF